MVGHHRHQHQRQMPPSPLPSPPKLSVCADYYYDYFVWSAHGHCCHFVSITFDFFHSSGAATIQIVGACGLVVLFYFDYFLAGSKICAAHRVDSSSDNNSPIIFRHNYILALIASRSTEECIVRCFGVVIVVCEVIFVRCISRKSVFNLILDESNKQI